MCNPGTYSSGLGSSHIQCLIKEKISDFFKQEVTVPTLVSTAMQEHTRAPMVFIWSLIYFSRDKRNASHAGAISSDICNLCEAGTYSATAGAYWPGKGRWINSVSEGCCRRGHGRHTLYKLSCRDIFFGIWYVLQYEIFVTMICLSGFCGSFIQRNILNWLSKFYFQVWFYGICFLVRHRGLVPFWMYRLCGWILLDDFRLLLESLCMLYPPTSFGPSPASAARLAATDSHALSWHTVL